VHHAPDLSEREMGAFCIELGEGGTRVANGWVLYLGKEKWVYSVQRWVGGGGLCGGGANGWIL
jgi:hypothetical protein